MHLLMFTILWCSFSAKRPPLLVGVPTSVWDYSRGFSAIVIDTTSEIATLYMYYSTSNRLG